MVLPRISFYSYKYNMWQFYTLLMSNMYTRIHRLADITLTTTVVEIENMVENLCINTEIYC